MSQTSLRTITFVQMYRKLRIWFRSTHTILIIILVSKYGETQYNELKLGIPDILARSQSKIGKKPMDATLDPRESGFKPALLLTVMSHLTPVWTP